MRPLFGFAGLAGVWVVQIQRVTESAPLTNDSLISLGVVCVLAGVIWHAARTVERLNGRLERIEYALGIKKDHDK